MNDGRLVVLGVIQEQHADRCRLFARWQEFEFPILHDPINVLQSQVVPILTAIDEHGIVRDLQPRLETFEAEFLDRSFPAETTEAEGSPSQPPDLGALQDQVRSTQTADAWRSLGDALVLWGGLAVIGLVLPLDVMIALTLGWAFFLGRVLPEVTIAREGVATALVCLVVFVVGAHAFLRGMARQRIAQGGEKGRPWPFRWTAAMTGFILVMFVAGIAATGVVHQVGRLLTSREPIVEWFVSVAAQRAQSSNNLKVIGIGVSNSHDSHGTSPPGATFNNRGRPLHGWQAMLLPFVEHQALYDQISFELPWDDPANRDPFQTQVLMFLNPGNTDRSDAAGYALSHYAGNARLLGGNVSRSLTDLTDGSSTTILAGEVTTDFRAWGHPIQWRDPALGINRSHRGFGSPFPPGGANFVFADGSVRFLKDTVAPQVLKALSTPAGNEAISNGMY